MMSPQDDPQDEEQQERLLDSVGKKSSSSTGKKSTPAAVCNTSCGGTTQSTISKSDSPPWAFLLLAAPVAVVGILARTFPTPSWSNSGARHWTIGSHPKRPFLSKTSCQNFSFGLRAFSIVRDPFDRLVSYFEYLGRFVHTNQFLKETVTDEQYQRVQAGDLYGWMELLHQQGGGCGLKLPFQYPYFHDDLDTAISLIQQDEETGAAPKIFVVLTECYEASLRLLAERFDEFNAESVDAFVASPEYKSNQNKNSITNRASYLKKDQDIQGLESLRELAQEWFKDDFVFYDVAVKQFQAYMEKSQLDPTHFESCAHWKGGGGSNAAHV